MDLVGKGGPLELPEGVTLSKPSFRKYVLTRVAGGRGEGGETYDGAGQSRRYAAMGAGTTAAVAAGREGRAGEGVLDAEWRASE